MNNLFKCNFIITCILFLVAIPALVFSGTYHAGVKGWYVTWDSAASQLFDEILEDIMTNRLPEISPFFEQVEYELDYNKGRGYLAGILLGYETDDRKWIFNMELLFLNSFTQKIDVSGELYSYSETVPVDVEMDRRDYELNGYYNINRYFHAFLGYKYQTYNLKSEVKVPYFTLPLDLVKYNYEAKFHILIPGIGAAFPFDDEERYRVGARLGLPAGYPQFEDKIRDEEIKIKGEYGFFGEIYGKARFGEAFQLRVGYGLEKYKAEVQMKERGIKSDVTETSHGVNIAGMVLF